MTGKTKLCATCAHALPLHGALYCALERSPVDDRPVYCASRRLFLPCGPEGNQWEPRPAIASAIAFILADPNASDWLKTAAITANPHDLAAARRDAEALLAALTVSEGTPCGSDRSDVRDMTDASTEELVYLQIQDDVLFPAIDRGVALEKVTWALIKAAASTTAVDAGPDPLRGAAYLF